MDQLNELLQQGSLHAWFFLPAAVLLGALHGLEPGHSKTMMAAFIIAVRGTVPQAILLGLAATFSHTLIIWVLAALALHFGRQWNAETTEPYFQIASAAMILGVALWMARRTRKDIVAETEHGHHHGHSHHHHHHDHDHGHAHHHDHGHSHHGHHHHEHEHVNEPVPLKAVTEYQDDHEKVHALEIEQRFAGRPVTTGQIVLFGLTGGLAPCPAAFTILLVCLQLKQFSIGMAMVLAFSIGLAATLVLVGVVAAWGARHAAKRLTGFGAMARRLPYLSSGVLILMAAYLGWEGWSHLAAAR